MSSSSARRTTAGVVFLTLFLDLVGFSIIFPLFPALLEHYGAQDSGVLHALLQGIERVFPGADPWQRTALFGGVLIVAYSGLQFLCAPLWGRASDRYGRRPILLISIFGNALSYLVWMFAGSFELLLLARFLSGVMGANLGAATAALADVSSKQERSRAMGLVGAAFGLGFILGPAIGGLAYALLPRFGTGTGWSTHPFSTPAVIALTLSVGNWLWVLLRFAETLPPEKRGQAGDERSANPARLFDAQLGRPVVRLNAAYFAYTVLFAGMETTLAFLTAQVLQYEPQENGWLFAWMGLCSAYVQGSLVRKLLRKRLERGIALTGIALLAPGFASIALCAASGMAWPLWLGVTVTAFASGFTVPPITGMVSLFADETRQGTVLGAFRGVGALGRAVGPMAGALLYFFGGPAAPFAVLGALAIVPWLLLRGVPQPPRSTS
jgi:MFS family permease